MSESELDEPELGAVRVVLCGEDLRIPDGDYRVVPGDWLEANDLDKLEALARAHGAVLFEVHEGGNDWAFAVLVHVDGPRSLLDIDGARSRLVARTPDRPFVALVGALQCNDIARWEALPELATPDLLLGHRDEHGARVWETAAWRLLPDPVQPLRDWMWLVPRSWGPLTLTIHLDASAAAIVQWLVTLGPSPYVLETEGRYRRPGHERGPMLRVRERALTLVRSYPAPELDVVAYDADVLAALVGGALGELTWDLVDEDYYDFAATGDDAASLAEYLSPACDRAAIEANRDRVFARHVCDASAAAAPEAVLRIVAASLGAPTDLDANELARWFAASAPRNLEVIVPRDFEARFGARWHDHLIRPRARLSIAYR